MKERALRAHPFEVRAMLTRPRVTFWRPLRRQPAPAFLARGVVRVVPQWPHQDGVRWFMADGASELLPCPYGAPSDHLWVQETFSPLNTEQPLNRYVSPKYRARVKFAYKADGVPLPHDAPWPWMASVRMPRWASRLTLSITSVRVERLHEVTDADAMALGLDGSGVYVPVQGVSPADGPRAEFAAHWESTEGKRTPRTSNPWVWRVEAERVVKPA